MTDAVWRRTGSTAVSRGPWIVARLGPEDARTYEVWHEQLPKQLAFCGSFDQAKQFVMEWEEKHGLV